VAPITAMRPSLRLARYFAVAAYLLVLLGIATVSYKEAYHTLILTAIIAVLFFSLTIFVAPLAYRYIRLIAIVVTCVCLTILLGLVILWAIYESYYPLLMIIMALGMFSLSVKSKYVRRFYVVLLSLWNILLSILFLILLFYVSNTLFIYIMAILCLSLLFTIKYWKTISDYIRSNAFLGLSFLALPLTLSLLVIMIFLGQSAMGTAPPPPNSVRRYVMVIEPQDINYEEFTIDEHFFVDRSLVGPGKQYEDEMNSLEKTVTRSSWKGLFTREVLISPSICTVYRCGNIDKVEIELRGINEGSFSEAMDGNNIKVNTWDGKDSINWGVSDISRGVAFTIYPKPYHYLRKISQPFSKSESYGQLLVTSLTIFISVIISSIVKPLVIDFGKNKSKQLLDKLSSKGATTKVRLIVSPTGDEKEIEVNRRRGTVR
jgi:hypothetical protein